MFKHGEKIDKWSFEAGFPEFHHDIYNSKLEFLKGLYMGTRFKCDAICTMIS